MAEKPRFFAPNTQGKSLVDYLDTNGMGFIAYLATEGFKKTLPVVGEELTIRESDHLTSLGFSGNGLYINRDFRKDEIITYYYGRLVKYVQRANVPPSKRSHMRTLFKLR